MMSISRRTGGVVFAVVLGVAAGCLPVGAAARGGVRARATTASSDVPADAQTFLAQLRRAVLARDWDAAAELDAQWGFLVDEAPADEATAARATRLEWLGRAFNETGRYDEYETTLRDLVDLMRADPAADTGRLALRVDQLAWLVHRLRPDDPEAESLFLDALDAVEADPASSAADRARQLAQLSHLSALRGDRATALERASTALDAFDASPRPHDDERATLLGRMVAMDRSLGRLDAAADAARRQLTVLAAAEGDEHPRLLDALGPLVAVLLDLDRADEAAPLAERAVTIAETAWGADSRRAETMRRLAARAHTALGDTPAAASAPRYRFDDDLTPTGNSALQRRATRIESEAVALTGQGRFDEAETRLLDALDLHREAAGGAESWEAARTLQQMAWLHEAQADDTRAEELLHQSLDEFDRTVGPAHPLTAHAWEQLWRFQSDRGRTAEAAESLTRAVGVWEAAGRDTPETARLRGLLASTLRGMARSDEARQVLDDAVATWDRVAGAASPAAARDLTMLAGLTLDAGRPAEAERLVLDALDRIGPDRPERALALRTMARVQAALDRPLAAADALAEALDLDRAWLADDPQALAAVLRQTAWQLRRLGLDDEAAPLTMEADSLSPVAD